MGMERDGVLRLEGIFRNGYGIVPKFVMHDQELTLESKAIYAYLCAMAGSGDQTFPYRDTILRHLGLSKNTYYRHYNALIRQGYLTVHRPADKTAPNIYTLVSNPKKLEDKPSGPETGEGMLRYKGLKSRGYGVLPRSVMLDSRLTIKSKGLYAYLCSYCGAGDRAFPRRDDIVFHLGISEPTYYKCYRQLLELGYLLAVQRKEGGRFGVNDYYLNDTPEASDSPHPKNCDTEKMKKSNSGDSPRPKNWDTKNEDVKNQDVKIGDTEKQDPNIWDAKKRDGYSNNSLSNNNYATSNPSTPESGTDGPDIRESDLQKLMTLTCEEHPQELAWISQMTAVQRRHLLDRFVSHMGDRLQGKKIRNLSAYVKSALYNWLLDQTLSNAFSERGEKAAAGSASYDLSTMESLIENGEGIR